jgi:diaminopimelate decarboxylase
MLVQALESRLAGVPIELRFEPGRSVVARAGVLLTRVLYRRERDGRPALVCDAGYTDFARNALYGAEHAIVPVDGELSGEPTVDVLGPTCESGDTLGMKRRLHDVEPGDLLMLRDAGAYGFVMASNYNSRPRPPELLVEEDAWQVVRQRESLEDLWRGEVIP